MYKVTSEIYGETNYNSVKGDNGRVLSKFKFKYPQDENIVAQNGMLVDKDGDLTVQRKRGSTLDGVIAIEHSEATELRLVGLQVWRELGAGVGLTSIAAAFYTQQVVCTDVNVGGILDLIRENVKHNFKLLQNRNKIDVLELDFLKPVEEYAPDLLKAIDNCDIVVAADVIYDDDLTNAFIHVIDVLFERGRLSGKNKTVLIALEKRYVFTLSDLDTTAPMFEYFLKQTIHKPWLFEYIDTNSFPQYFEYDRSRHLVLLKVTYGK
ncbi:methyltransferase-like protein 22 isoform X2 [Bactrocera tryoni]|uniref:methyltransferase-like protein 22 isoform X2 n=1 Tax=Bactrocera tryoni TaxID=59916 RepID=UPI001A987DC2|nr:methyltransferase-like protein 22 isoform X2 [Bactrocera tryoni]